jgi:cellular nucleic acid-binding protein
LRLEKTVAWQRSVALVPTVSSAMAADVQSLFQALEILTRQVTTLAEQKGGDKKGWHYIEKYKNIKIFDGTAKEYEEFHTKFVSQIGAGDNKVKRLMMNVENNCSEEMLTKGRYDECMPEFDENDSEFVMESSGQMYNVLLGITTGEANAIVRRCNGHGWLAWKKLTSSLNPRTLASGIKAISAVLSPGKISQAAKADIEIENWEDKMSKLNTEYGQELSSKMKVAVLYSMLPKELQEKVLDECAVNWDGTPESEAGRLFGKIKASIKNIAKSRREMSGPKPMEVDRVKNWSDCEWEVEWQEEYNEKHEDQENQSLSSAHEIYLIGKGGKKGGKGFQGHCYTCGEFGHSQWDCKGKGKAKGYGKDSMKGKGYGKDGMKGKGYGKSDLQGKGHGKQWYGKGYDKDWGEGGKGTGGGGKGGKHKSCFGCGETGHWLKDCPKMNNQVQQVEDEPVLYTIHNVKDEWKKIPMRVKARTETSKKIASSGNRFKILEIDDDDTEEEAEHIGVSMVTVNDEEAGTQKTPPRMPAKSKNRIGAVSNNPYGCRQKATGAVPNDPCEYRWKDTLVQKTVNHSMSRYGDPPDHLFGPEKVAFVRAVGHECDMQYFGKGDILVDSAADESCWPVGVGDAYPTTESARKMRLRTANGAEMGHYGEKEVSFLYDGGEVPIKAKFQVTDVGKPLMSVRRVVESGNTVILSNNPGESCIINNEKNLWIPIAKKGNNFVIEAQYVKKGFTRQA